MSKQITRQPSKQQRRRDRREEDRRREEERLRRKRNRGIIVGAVIAALVLIIAGSVFALLHKPGTTSANSPIQTVNPAYPPIDNNVGCDTQEQDAFHIHAYLTIWINGQQSSIPANMGIATDQSCLYWLHTHDTTGVVHIEAPANRSFILGNFFDEWEQVFSSLNYPSQLDLSTGWTVYVNGNLYKGSFRNIPLQAHTIITMAYNSPGVKPVTSYNWNGL